MPFYGLFFKLFYQRQRIKIVTLQVRILNAICVLPFTCRRKPGKRACLSASGSLTLEAALALSLFIFVSVIMLLPMKIMNTQRRLQAQIESVGEDFSRYAYLADAVESGKVGLIPGADEFAKGFCKNLSSGVAAGYTQAMTLRASDTGSLFGTSVLQSSFREEGEIYDLILDYQIRMPFPVIGMNAVSGTVRSRRRAWVGKDMRDEAGGSEGDDDEIVYIGKGSTRYHRSSSCHYLANNLTAVSYEMAGERRNDSGGKYHACAVCGAGAGPGDTVYIMPSGSSYHRNAECRAIIAYVRAVPLSQVRHLGACSYCGGGS